MSTLERAVMDVDAAPHPSTSLALVPLRSDRVEMGPVLGPAKHPQGIHRVFYTLWYLGAAMFPLAAWVGVWSWNAPIGFYVLGVGFVGLGGLGIMAHVLYRPRMEKLRLALGAGAALVLAIASMEPLRGAGMEVYAAPRVSALEPLAADLARHGHIREIGGSQAGRVRLNGFTGEDTGPDVVSLRARDLPHGLELQDVLDRDGITRAEYTAFMERLGSAGVAMAAVAPGYVAFRHDEHGDLMLLHVLPGHVLPRDVPLLTWDSWRTEPLGGGWFLVLHGRGR